MLLSRQRLRESLYLVRSRNLRFLYPEHDQRGHRHPVEDPDGEGEEVDQALDVALQDHHVGNQGLEKTYLDLVPMINKGQLDTGHATMNDCSCSFLLLSRSRTVEMPFIVGRSVLFN